MPRIRDLLYRFRPAGAPGVAGPAGVPVDRVADLAAELAPVLAHLGPVQQRCAEIVAAARSEAARVLAEESAAAGGIVARARTTADAERAAAAARVRQQWDREADELLAAAEEEAARIRRHATVRRAAYVEDVEVSVRAMLAGVPLVSRSGR